MNEKDAALLMFIKTVAGCKNCDGCRHAAETALLFFTELAGEVEVKVDKPTPKML